MKQVRRFDRGGLSKPVKLDNGWMRCDAYLTRTGVFSYLDSNGKERREYRPPDEVFKADSLSSFSAVPVTNDHPPEALDATNTNRYQVGHVDGMPAREGDKMRARLLITDAGVISAMESGKRELSNGYLVHLDETPGVSPEGERYDAVQRNITGNHVAIVDEGRAGPECRARMDAATRLDPASAWMVLSETHEPIQGESATQANEVRKVKMTFDKAQVEVADDVAALIDAERKSAQKRIDELQAKADSNEARADKLAKEVNDSKAALAAAPEKVKAEMAARAKLEQVAKAVGVEKADALDDKELKLAIAKTQAPEGVDLSQKSDAYVDVLVDSAAARADERQDAQRVMDETQAIPTDPKPAERKSFTEIAAGQFNKHAPKK